MSDAGLQQKRLIAAAIDAGVLVVVWTAMSAFAVALSCSGALTDIEFLGTYGTPLIVVAMLGLALVYVVGRDVVTGDRSLGKKLMGIRLFTEAGAPIGVLESVKRNSLFAPGLALALLSVLLGLVPVLGCVLQCLLWPVRVAAGLFVLGAVVYEVIQILQQPDGVRLGDKLARTRVSW